jgi:hypothetical protein
VNIGDLVREVSCELTNGRTGVITRVWNDHWDKNLPGYVPGGYTYRIRWFEGDPTCHDESELEVISESR